MQNIENETEIRSLIVTITLRFLFSYILPTLSQILSLSPGQSAASFQISCERPADDLRTVETTCRADQEISFRLASSAIFAAIKTAFSLVHFRS